MCLSHQANDGLLLLLDISGHWRYWQRRTSMFCAGNIFSWSSGEQWLAAAAGHIWALATFGSVRLPFFALAMIFLGHQVNNGLPLLDMLNRVYGWDQWEAATRDLAFMEAWGAVGVDIFGFRKIFWGGKVDPDTSVLCYKNAILGLNSTCDMGECELKGFLEVWHHARAARLPVFQKRPDACSGSFQSTVFSSVRECLSVNSSSWPTWGTCCGCLNGPTAS
jgi:hypothetical protein